MDWCSPLAVLFPQLQGAVLHAMWRRPVAMTGREVHRVVGSGSYTGTLAALRHLVDQGLVDARRVGQATQYALNRDHLAYPALEAALEQFKPRSDLDERLRTTVQDHLPADFGKVTLAYFGSFARGHARADSDIDLLLVLPDSVSQRDEEEIVDALEQGGRRWTGNPVQVYSARVDDLSRAVHGDDPIVENWDRDAHTVMGTAVQRLLKELR